MRFLPANRDTWIDVPIKYGHEFTEPTSDISVTVNLNGTITNSVQGKGCFSSFPLLSPASSVAVDQLGYASVSASGLTPLGAFNWSDKFALFNYDDLFATHEDVRVALGVRQIEVLDEEIEIEQMYLKMYRLFKPAFHLARQTDILLNNTFGQLIVLLTAAYSAPKLLLRLSQKETTENGDFQRLGTGKDLLTLIGDLKAKANDMLLELNDELLVPLTGSASVFALLAMPHESTGTTS